MQRFLFALFLMTISFACSRQVVKEPPKVEAISVSPSHAYPSAYIIKEQVNLRARPDTRSAVVKKLTEGEEIQLVRNVNGWYEALVDPAVRGWLRSDLAGPRSLSRTRLAAAFVDSLLPAFKCELYLDKKELYRIIYLNLPDLLYQNKSAADELAIQIGLLYQQKVYPAAIEIRIMTKDNQQLFSRLNLKASGLADVPVPVLTVGRLLQLSEHSGEVTLHIATPDSVDDKALMKMARNISAGYEYPPFTKAEIFIVTDEPEAVRYLQDKELQLLNRKSCRLHYLEDGHGELYKFSFCQP